MNKIIILLLLSNIIFAQDRQISLLFTYNRGQSFSKSEYFRNQVSKEIENYDMVSTNHKMSNFKLNINNTILDQSLIEGIDKIYVIKAISRLSISSYFDNKGFFIDSIIFKGTGNSYDDAFNNGIMKSNLVSKLLPSLKTKIINYLNENKSIILADINKKRSEKDYLKCLGLIRCITKEVQWYNETLELEKEVFKQYETENCKNLIKRADLELAATRYKDALYYLDQIYIDSPCSNDYNRILNEIKLKSDKILEKEILDLEYRKNKLDEDRYYIIRKLYN